MRVKSSFLSPARPLGPGVMPSHHPTQRLQRLEAGAAARRVDADALGLVVVDGDEDRDLPLLGPGRRHVGAPHGVDPVRDDRAVVVARPAWSATRPGASARRSEVRIPPIRSLGDTFRCPSR